MKLETYGILIGLRPFGERDAIAHIFTRDYGVMCGMLKGAQVAKKAKPLIGQVGSVSWNARLDSQLGAFHWESERNLAAPLMLHAKLLTFMNAAFALVATLLPEREKYDQLFNQTLGLLCELAGNTEQADAVYLKWETDLLQELGYGLNLSSCSNCGATNNLNYLSPRTGRAVCDECAQPYLDKLFKLPLTLETTENFLLKIYEQHGGELPIARKLFRK